MEQTEMIWHYAGVLTDLREHDVRALMSRGPSLARAIWGCAIRRAACVPN